MIAFVKFFVYMFYAINFLHKPLIKRYCIDNCVSILLHILFSFLATSDLLPDKISG